MPLELPEGWRVSAELAGPRSGAQMLGHVLVCHELFKRLTPAQRRWLLDPDPGRSHKRVLAALVEHGLAEGDGRLTEAGAEIRRWNLPDGHPDREVPGAA